MTNEKAHNILENYAFYLKDGTKYMKPEQEQQFRQAYEMAIKALEQTCWIPVNERLPEEAERVLVYAERNAYDDKGKFRKKVIDIGWQVNGRWNIDCCSGVEGIAWMPLPKPYKAESEEKA